jgi:Dna[CI] antecedent, DciA
MDPLGPLADAVVPRLIANAPLTPEKVGFAWRTAVGPGIDRATRVRLAGSVLRVTGEPQWLREVERSQGLIVTRLQRLLGSDVVRRIACDG